MRSFFRFSDLLTLIFEVSEHQPKFTNLRILRLKTL